MGELAVRHAISPFSLTSTVVRGSYRGERGFLGIFNVWRPEIAVQRFRVLGGKSVKRGL